MRVLVCGSRTFNDYDLLQDVLKQYDITEIIHGGARGADSGAARYADECGIPVKTFPADWKSFGRAAGPIRNIAMLKAGNPDLVIAFLGKIARLEFESGLSDSPYSKGTKHMIEIAQKAGVEVKVVKIR